jgi:hypothetical protein
VLLLSMVTPNLNNLLLVLLNLPFALAGGVMPMSALGHKQTSRDVRVTSVLSPIADIRRMRWDDPSKSDEGSATPKAGSQSCGGLITRIM